MGSSSFARTNSAPSEELQGDFTVDQSADFPSVGPDFFSGIGPFARMTRLTLIHVIFAHNIHTLHPYVASTRNIPM